MLENIVIIVGIIGALVTAAVALYRARPQKDLDRGTKEKIDMEVRRLQTEHDRRRTIRLLRLEKYVDEDVDYHRQIAALLRYAKDQGCLPPDTVIPEPPDLPEMPDE